MMKSQPISFQPSFGFPRLVRQGRAVLLAAGMIAALGAGPLAFAQSTQSPSLPGGSTALREAYGDWTVNCAIVDRDKTKSKVCSMVQEVFETKSHQRVLSAEIVPVTGNTTAANAVLVLPFGLALDRGAVLQIDTTPKSEKDEKGKKDEKADRAKKGDKDTPISRLSFKTCLPVGCVASGSLNATGLAALRAGGTLTVQVRPSDGTQDTSLSLSLNGFSDAFNRTQALLAQNP